MRRFSLHTFSSQAIPTVIPRTLLCCLAAIFLPNLAHAQFLLNAHVSYELGLPRSLTRTPGLINFFGKSGTGLGEEHFAGIGLGIEQRLTPFFSVNGDLEYSLGFVRFLSDVTTKLTRRDELAHQFQLNANEQYINEDILAHFSIGTFGVEVGPFSEFLIAASPVETEFAGPDITRVQNSSRIRAQGDTLIGTRFHYGARLKIDLPSIRLFSLQLLPKITGRLDISERPIASSALSIGASLGIPLYRSMHGERNDEASPLTNQTIAYADSSTIRNPAPSISVRFVRTRGIQHEKDPVILERIQTFHETVLPFPKMLSFDLSNVQFASAYNLISADAARTYSKVLLARKHPLGLIGESLNLLGLFLRDHPEAKLNILNSAGDTGSLAQDHLRIISDYFQRTWQIAFDRFSVTNSPLAISPHACLLRLSTGVPEPFEIPWIEQEFRLPDIDISKSLLPAEAFRSWELQVTEGDHTVANYSSADTALSQSLDIDIELANTVSKKGAFPLVATLRAIRTDGTLMVARDTLLVQYHAPIDASPHYQSKVVDLVLPSGANEDLPPTIVQHITEHSEIISSELHGTSTSLRTVQDFGLNNLSTTNDLVVDPALRQTGYDPAVLHIVLTGP